MAVRPSVFIPVPICRASVMTAAVVDVILAAGSGWVSGTISNPKECSGISAYTCDQCHALSTNPAVAESCRACIRTKNVTAAAEVSMGDMAEIWCKRSDGLYAMHTADGNTRYSEFGCLYDVSSVLQGATEASGLRECEARRIRDVCLDEDFAC
jgi:ribosomal protein L40E